MLFNIADISKETAFLNVDENALRRMADAVETAIREHTHNNFQNRLIRFEAAAENNVIKGTHPFLRVGDTVEISESANKGLYVVKEIADGQIKVNKELYPVAHNLITKVEYPADVIAGALELMKWRAKFGGKIGVKSETISRHSVTYYDNTATSTGGYPAALMGFLTPYMKARF